MLTFRVLLYSSFSSSPPSSSSTSFHFAALPDQLGLVGPLSRHLLPYDRLQSLSTPIRWPVPDRAPTSSFGHFNPVRYLYLILADYSLYPPPLVINLIAARTLQRQTPRCGPEDLDGIHHCLALEYSQCLYTGAIQGQRARLDLLGRCIFLSLSLSLSLFCKTLVLSLFSLR